MYDRAGIWRGTIVHVNKQRREHSRGYLRRQGRHVETFICCIHKPWRSPRSGLCSVALARSRKSQSSTPEIHFAVSFGRVYTSWAFGLQTFSALIVLLYFPDYIFWYISVSYNHPRCGLQRSRTWFDCATIYIPIYTYTFTLQTIVQSTIEANFISKKFHFAGNLYTLNICLIMFLHC